MEFVAMQFWHWCSVAKHLPHIRCLCNIKFLLEPNKSNLKDRNEMTGKKNTLQPYIRKTRSEKNMVKVSTVARPVAFTSNLGMSALYQNRQLQLLLAIACTIYV
jgi:hypothetical protein